MLFKYYYWGLIILWVFPGNLCDTCNTNLIEFWGDNGARLYFSTRQMNLNWYEAFCCCRSKGKTLISADNQQRLKKIKRGLSGILFYGVRWFDGYESEGKWRHAGTGEVLPSEVFDSEKFENAPEGFCTILDTHWLVLKRAHCEDNRPQFLLCEEMKSDGDCYPTGLNPNPLKECNMNAVLEYTKENVCPRRVLTTPASTMSPTPSASATPPEITTRSPKVCYECSEIACSSN